MENIGRSGREEVCMSKFVIRAVSSGLKFDLRAANSIVQYHRVTYP